jgi:hypothetical protein
MVCLPSGRTWEARTSTAVSGMMCYSALNGIQLGIINLEGSMITKQRNDLVEMAQKQECDFMLFIDSVTPETPIVVRRKGEKFIDLVEACELLPPSLRFEHRRTYTTIDYEVLTHQGWQVPEAVMQAKVRKPIIRVTDERGTVSVTEDHSLMSGGVEIAGRDLQIGTKLDHIELDDLDLPENSPPPITEDYAEVLGFFAAEGTCGEYYKADGSPACFQWNICNQDKGTLERYQRVLESVHCRAFSFIADQDKRRRADGGEAPVVWKLTATRPGDLVKQYAPMFYTHTGKKRVPKIILNAPARIVRAFLRGYEAGDGHWRDDRQHSTTNSMTLAAGLHLLYWRMGRDFGFNGQRHDKPEIVHMFERTHGQEHMKSPPGVRHLQRDESYDGWVYDLCTPAGTFVGGAGLFVLHNTDMTFPPNTLVRLLSHNKEVVGATYNKRVPPFETLGRLKGQKPSEEDLAKGGIWPAELLPTGCLLIKMTVFQKIGWPYFYETYQWPGATGVEAFKEMVRESYSVTAPEQMLATIDGTAFADWLNMVHKVESASEWRYFSEDLQFCRKCLKHGIELWCDLGLTFEMVHLGVNEVTCKPMGPAAQQSMVVPAVM